MVAKLVRESRPDPRPCMLVRDGSNTNLELHASPKPERAATVSRYPGWNRNNCRRIRAYCRPSPDPQLGIYVTIFSWTYKYLVLVGLPRLCIPDFDGLCHFAAPRF